MSLKKVKYNRDGEWKYVCRELREIKGVVYVFNFFYCEGNNEIQVKFYNLADGTEAIDVIVLDVDLKFKTRHEICEIIKYDIAYRISVWEDTIQLHSWSDEILSDGNILSSLRKLQAFVRNI